MLFFGGNALSNHYMISSSVNKGKKSEKGTQDLKMDLGLSLNWAATAALLHQQGMKDGKLGCIPAESHSKHMFLLER